MKTVLKGTLISLIITFAVILILSVITYFSNTDSKLITVGIYAGVVAGVVMGAFVTARSSERQVLLHSMLVSVIYIAVLITVSIAINHTLRLNAHFVTMTTGILASGFLGAVLGK